MMNTAVTCSKTTLLVALLFSNVRAFPSYADMMPNGNNIDGYPAIGHLDDAGLTGENAFGSAYVSTWTSSAYCFADSDGDGYTNGQELGDPCCIWTTSSASPEYTTGLGHPGIATIIPTNAALLEECETGTATGEGGSSGILLNDDEDDSSESAPVTSSGIKLDSELLVLLITTVTIFFFVK